jgi:hypothetical protein
MVFVSRLSSPAVLSRLSCPGCPIPAVLSILSFPGCAVPVVFSQLKYPVYSVPTVLSGTSCLAVLFRRSCSFCSVQTELSGRFVQADLSRLTCPSSSVLTVLPWLSYPGFPACLVLFILFQLFCPSSMFQTDLSCDLSRQTFPRLFSVLDVLPRLLCLSSCPNCPVLSCSSCPAVFILLRLSCHGCPALPVLSICTVPAALSTLISPELLVLFLLSCTDCNVISVCSSILSKMPFLAVLPRLS